MEYCKEEIKIDMDSCPICTVEFIEGDQVTRMPPCGHFVHEDCARSWFDTKNQEREQRCPLCNLQLDITILRDLKKEKEKRDMSNLNIVEGMGT